MSVNITVQDGFLGRDADLREVGQNVVAAFSIANTKFFKDRQGERKEKTNWFNVEWWNPSEKQQAALTKGRKVLVQGELEESSWEDDEGNKKSRIFIRANRVDIDFNTGNSDDEEEQAPRRAASKKTPAKTAAKATPRTSSRRQQASYEEMPWDEEE